MYHQIVILNTVAKLINVYFSLLNKAEFVAWMLKMKEMKQSLYERSKIAVQLKRNDRLQREKLANNQAQQLEELRFLNYLLLTNSK